MGEPGERNKGVGKKERAQDAPPHGSGALLTVSPHIWQGCQVTGSCSKKEQESSVRTSFLKNYSIHFRADR